MLTKSPEHNLISGHRQAESILDIRWSEGDILANARREKGG